ncbi:T9SS type B sorting domain-containing protein [Empedobacter falsenii]
MKKIFYFLLLMLSGFVWGQHPLTRIDPNELNFYNIPLTLKTVDLKTTTSCGGRNDGRTHAAMLYFKADYDLDLKFDLIGQLSSDYAIIVYKVKDTNGDGIPNEVFQTNTTITALRSIYSTHTTKSLEENSTDLCEFYGDYGTSDGKVKSLEFEANNYVVIAIQASPTAGTNPVFDLHLKIAKTVDNLVFDSHCYTDDYLLADVKTKITDDIRTKDPSIIVRSIQFYKPDNTSTSDNISYANGIEQILYARVYDNSGKLVYIYKPIKFKFIPELIYTIQNAIEQFCAPQKRFIKDYLISKISSSNVDPAKYADYEVYVDDVKVNGFVDLQNSTTYKVKLEYIGTEFCATTQFSDEVDLKLISSNPTLPDGKFGEVCNDETLTEAQILAALGVDMTNFKLVNMPATPYVFVGNEAKFNVQIVDRTDDTCVSNEVEFTVKKKSNVSLNTLPDFVDCRNEFTFEDFRHKIDEVKNDNDITLEINYNGTNYAYSQLQSLYDLIISTTTQRDFDFSITGNKAGFCETTVPLKITLNNSSVPTESFDVLFNPGCLGVNEDYTFSVNEIKEHIKGELGFVNIADFDIFNLDKSPIQPVNILANSNETLIFKVKKVGESCFSELMTLDFQTINQPNVSSATYSDKFCEGETLTIDDHLLRDYFGANVSDYKIFIDGTEYIQGNPIPKVLGFEGNPSLNIPIEFKNRLSDTCSTIVDLTVNKKDDLNVNDPSLEAYIQANPIVFCEGEDEDAKNQIQAILDYIQTNYSLISSKRKEEIFAEFNSAQSSVDVDFYNSSYCGLITFQLNYQKNALPNIEVKNPDPLCAGEIYKLDFTTQTGYENYNYHVEKEDGTGVSGIYTFDLDAENYKITIEDKNSGCSVVKTLEIKNTIPPTINKITINEKSIIVSAKGNGKLEYALFDSTGNVIVDWQTNNELIIPNEIKDNNFTVRVKLNNCGVSERKEVIYLALPNVVTPNNDRFNNVWQPMTKNGKVNDTSNSYKLIIFDRYGKHILSQEGIGIIEWDGTHNGKPVADGTYWYLLEFSKQSEDLQVLYSGSILVKRKIN